MEHCHTLEERKQRYPRLVLFFNWFFEQFKSFFLFLLFKQFNPILNPSLFCVSIRDLLSYIQAWVKAQRIFFQ